MLHAKNCFIVLLDLDNIMIALICNYFNYFDLVMRASSLLAFRCYFELPSINKDFTHSLTNEPLKVPDIRDKDLILPCFVLLTFSF